MNGLAGFLDASPTSFHAAGTIAERLEQAGWTALDEKDQWNLEPGRGYFTVRDGRSAAAFIPGHAAPAESGLRIITAHLDSPAWKVKNEGAVEENGLLRIPVEAYGAPIFRTWLDRELEIAGLAVFRGGNGTIESRRWRSGGATAVIPSLALHLDKDVNKGIELNPQEHMAALMPLDRISPSKPVKAGGNPSSPMSGPLERYIAKDLGIPGNDLLSVELYLLPSDRAAVVGGGTNRWIMSGRLDNLAMAHAILESLPETPVKNKSGLLAFWFDAEEVGSRTASGAASLYMDEIIERMVLAGGGDRENLLRTRRASFMVSADMAHALHPGHKAAHDPAYSPAMGAGPVLKSHGQRHYATDVLTEARITQVAQHADVPLQKLIFRSDRPCGYSLGPLASAAASLAAVDIGSPLWAMHSARETASLSDHELMIELMRGVWKN